jgi:hypothetical protein
LSLLHCCHAAEKREKKFSDKTCESSHMYDRPRGVVLSCYSDARGQERTYFYVSNNNENYSSLYSISEFILKTGIL